MSYYLKTFFMIYLLLFTVSSNSVAQETTSDDVLNLSAVQSLGLLTDRKVCSYDVIRVRPEPIDQIDEQGLIINLTGDRLMSLDGAQSNIETIRVELLFTIQLPGRSGTFRVIGVGESNFQINLEVNDPIDYKEHPSVAITDAVKESVRDGYRKLRDFLEEFVGPRQPISHISVLQGDRILIPLGRSDHVQEGDVFNVYPPAEESVCISYSPSLATATVIEIDDSKSILEMNIVPNGRVVVRVGDIVKLSPDINFESRMKESNEPPKPNLLKFVSTPRIYVRLLFDDDGRVVAVLRNITPYIGNFLRIEGPGFGFHVFEEFEINPL